VSQFERRRPEGFSYKKIAERTRAKVISRLRSGRQAFNKLLLQHGIEPWLVV
jgi:hypothetical protein